MKFSILSIHLRNTQYIIKINILRLRSTRYFHFPTLAIIDFYSCNKRIQGRLINCCRTILNIKANGGKLFRWQIILVLHYQQIIIAAWNYATTALWSNAFGRGSGLPKFGRISEEILVRENVREILNTTKTACQYLLRKFSLPD